MLNAVVNTPILPITAKTFLLIPSRFPPIRLYERIAENFHEAVTKIEDLTNPRLQQKKQIIEISDINSQNPSLQNWNHAPFAYVNPEGSWFFDPNTPCLEVSADIQTALAVSVAKRHKFLARTKQDKLCLDMRVIVRKISGHFLDVKKFGISMNKEERWKLGKQILEMEKVDGVIFHSPERLVGTRFAILNGQCLERAMQGDHYRYVWDGTCIKELYSFAEGHVINPDDLQSEHDILSAA